jgi:DNA-binding protein HU-beta
MKSEEDIYMADKSLNRTELVAAVASESGQSQAAVSGVVDAFFSVVSKSVADGTKVTIPGWIAFEKTHRAARTGRNPQTGEALEIAASDSVKVSAGSKLKAAVK